MGNLYQPRSADEIKAVILRDIRLCALDAGLPEPPTTPGTDWDMLAAGLANMALLGFANLAAAEEDTSVLTAAGDALEQHRVAEGLVELPATAAGGKIVVTVLGVTTIPNGQAFTYPNGLSGKIVGTFVNPQDQAELDAIAIDTGAATNLQGGETVRFKSPPVNVATDAKVSRGEPLRGGTDEEQQEDKRARILEARRNKAGGGNWAQIRSLAKQALGSVQDCYVYQALGGAGSAKVVPVKDLDPDTLDFTRSLSSTALAVVRRAIQSTLPGMMEIVVQGAVDQPVDFTVLVTIPESTLAGGNGRGWTDNPLWPLLLGGDAGKITITAVAATNDVITVSALTTLAPTAGQVHVAWWSAVDRVFSTALVTAVSGSSGAWVLTLDRPLIGLTGVGPAVGDYLSPSAQNLASYGDAWVTIFRSLGPGENTSGTTLGSRRTRRPFVSDEDPSNVTNTALGSLAKQFSEITNYAFGYAPVTAPTVPASVDTAPNLLLPRKFGVYKQ